MNINKINTAPHGQDKISTVLSDLKLQLKETPRDGHCLLHSVIGSWKGQIDYRSNLHIGALIIKAEKELHVNMHNYIAYLALNKDDEDIIMTYKEKYFTHKIYDHDLGDLIPTILSNALNLEINIIEDFNIGNARKTSIKPEQRVNRNEARHAIFIHLKNEHYSALVPRKQLFKTHQINGGPDNLNFRTNKFIALYDAPDTCIYTEDASDHSPRSQTTTASNMKAEDRSAINRNIIHENSSRSM